MSVAISSAAPDAAAQFVKAPQQPIVTDLLFDDEWMLKHFDVVGRNIFIPKHSHPYEHTTYLSAGALRVWLADDVAGPFQDHAAPALIRVPALTKHTFMTLTGKTVFTCMNRQSATGEVEIAAEHQLVETL